MGRSDRLPFLVEVVDTWAMRRILLLLLILLAGCTASPPTALPSPTDTLVSTDTLVPTLPSTPTTPATGVWRPLFVGAEVLETADGFTVVRHFPTSVVYGGSFESASERGKQVSGWLDEDDQALVAVNCGFYQENGGAYQHMGLLMVNGEGWSELRSNWGGVLIVRDGQAFIAPRPERLLAPATLGLQGWPMLVQNQTVVSRLNDEDLGRRTAVGVDAQGRLVWVVARNGITLADFAQRLRDSDLGLVIAVNLDGGVSSGLRWRAPEGEGQEGPDSLPIPCAIRLGPIG